jgi:hypothetical protein
VKKLIVLALAPVLALFSCTPPPFNLALSEGSATASRMSFVGEVGPISSFFTGMGAGNLAFYPEKDPASGFTLQTGFVTWSWQSGPLQIAYVASNGSDYRVVGSPQGLGPLTMDPAYPGYVIQSIKGSNGNVAFSWDPAQPSQFKSTVMPGNPLGNTYASPSWADMSPVFTAAQFGIPATKVKIRHVGIYPDPNTGWDKVYALVQNTSSGLFEEAEFNISSTGLSLPSVPRLRSVGIDLSSVGSTGIPLHALYYYDPSSTQGFANWWDSTAGAWVTWKWHEGTPGSAVSSQLPGITHRIDAMLSTGELFSTEGGVGRVYDQDGNLGARFMFAGLSFAGEVYVGGEARMLFSQPLWYNHQLHFNVYAIATKDVKSLQ